MGIASINPATGETIKTFEALTQQALEDKLNLAHHQFLTYRRTSFEARSIWLTQAATILEAERDRVAKLITLEMGKPIQAAIAEVEKSASVCRFYADHAAQFLADAPVETNASNSFIRYQPLGVILAVMPWNFPFWQVFRFAAPALMAGNVGLLKHASNVPQSALAIEEILIRAGFPDGAFQTLLIGADRVAEIVSDDRIKAATLTGSEPAGAALAATAGKHLKKVVLELGGSDPFIVMPSANLDAAVDAAVAARMINNGQSCIAAKRFILADAIADRFLDRLVQQYEALKVGDPMLAETQIGPLATPGILKDLDQQVKTSIQQGATCLIGGEPMHSRGNYYPPTILTDIANGNIAEHDEFFGPVALVFRVRDLDGAIERANNSPFGLGASAWTQNQTERDRLITEIESGSVFINSMVKSDVRLPFGGIKRSGFGRELGKEGIHEFVNIKTVWID